MSANETPRGNGAIDESAGRRVPSDSVTDDRHGGRTTPPDVIGHAG